MKRHEVISHTIAALHVYTLSCLPTAPAFLSLTPSPIMTTFPVSPPPLLQHVVAVRQVFNPLEKDDVIGITNYLDIGLQLAVPLVDTGAAGGHGTAAGLQLGGSWQVGLGLKVTDL